MTELVFYYLQFVEENLNIILYNIGMQSGYFPGNIRNGNEKKGFFINAF